MRLGKMAKVLSEMLLKYSHLKKSSDREFGRVESVEARGKAKRKIIRLSDKTVSLSLGPSLH